MSLLPRESDWQMEERVELVLLGCSDRLSSALLGLPHVCTSFVPLWTAVISTLYRHAKGTKGAQGRTQATYALGTISGLSKLVYKHPAFLRRPELGPRKKSDGVLYTKAVRRLIHQLVSNYS